MRVKMLEISSAQELSLLAKDGYTCLNLGSSKRIVKGAINLDIEPFKGVDVVHDLTKFPLPFKQNYFDFILAENVLEHIPKEKIDGLMRELNRILKKGGVLFMSCPHFTSNCFFLNDHYYNFCNMWSIREYIENPFSTDAITYTRKMEGFKLLKSKIYFPRTYGRFLFNVPYEFFVNLSNKTRLIYEDSVLRINPALGMFFWLEKLQ